MTDDLVSFVTELHACLSAGEAPIDGDSIAVHSPVPDAGFVLEVPQRWDAVPPHTAG